MADSIVFPQINAITAENNGYGGDDCANPNRGPLKLIDADENELGLIWRSSINEKQARMAVALADLFAAAPDMLAALKALEASGLLKTLTDMDDAMREEGEDAIAAPVVGLIRAAILKAEAAQ